MLTPYSSHLYRLAWRLVLSSDIHPDNYLTLFKDMADFLDGTPADQFTVKEWTEDGRKHRVPLYMPDPLQKKAEKHFSKNFPERLAPGRYSKDEMSFTYFVGQAITILPMQIALFRHMHKIPDDVDKRVVDAYKDLLKVWGGEPSMNARHVEDSAEKQGTNEGARNMLLKKLRDSEEPARKLGEAVAAAGVSKAP